MSNEENKPAIELTDDLVIAPIEPIDEVWVATDHNGGLYYIAGDYDQDMWEDDLEDYGHFMTWHKMFNIGEPHMYKRPQEYFSSVVYKAYLGKVDVLFGLLASKVTPYSIVANMSLLAEGYTLSDKTCYGECNYYLCGPMEFSNGIIKQTILGGLTTNDPAKATGTDLSEISYAIRDFTMDGLKAILDRSPDVMYILVYLKEGDETHNYELSIKPYNTPNSGCIGVFTITKEEALKQLRITTDDWKSEVKNVFKSTIAQYNAMISGNVYTFYHSPVPGNVVDPSVLKEDLFRKIGYDIDYGYVGDFEYALDNYASTLGLEVLCTATEYVESQQRGSSH